MNPGYLDDLSFISMNGDYQVIHPSRAKFSKGLSPEYSFLTKFGAKLTSGLKNEMALPGFEPSGK
jgi:hypothetical protein